LTDALLQAAPVAREGTVVSVDLFYEPHTHDSHRPIATKRASAEKVIAVEMETATLFALGSAHADVAVACILVVSDTFSPEGARARIDDNALLAAAESMGGAAVTALGRCTPAQ
jgi:uridine phosphorylase